MQIVGFYFPYEAKYSHPERGEVVSSTHLNDKHFESKLV